MDQDGKIDPFRQKCKFGLHYRDIYDLHTPHRRADGIYHSGERRDTRIKDDSRIHALGGESACTTGGNLPLYFLSGLLLRPPVEYSGGGWLKCSHTCDVWCSSTDDRGSALSSRQKLSVMYF